MVSLSTERSRAGKHPAMHRVRPLWPVTFRQAWPALLAFVPLAVVARLTLDQPFRAVVVGGLMVACFAYFRWVYLREKRRDARESELAS